MKNKIIDFLKNRLYLNNIPPDLKKEDEYLFGQIFHTYLGLSLVILVLLGYLVSYLILHNMLLSKIVFLSLIPAFVSFFYFIQNPIKRKIISSNILIFVLFLPTYFITLFTGGIDSSTIIWLSIYPAIMVFMTGIRVAAVWFIISILSISSLHFIPEVKINKMLIGSSIQVERLLDLLIITISIFSIISFIDFSYNKTLKKLRKSHQQLRILATTDPLTELFNRRFFEERAETEINRAIRYQKPITLLMLDLDHFKNINDSFGHKAGDYVLVEVSKIFKKNLRDIDLIGRYGGEEFIMLFPESDQLTSLAVAERIRKTIEKRKFIFKDNQIKVTISIGIAELIKGNDNSLDTFIEYADEALYVSKDRGRNKITVRNNKEPYYT